jgi:hypothetical protein
LLKKKHFFLGTLAGARHFRCGSAGAWLMPASASISQFYSLFWSTAAALKILQHRSGVLLQHRGASTWYISVSTAFI